MLALEERGHELHGLWTPDPGWYTTVGPLPFGHVAEVPRRTGGHPPLQLLDEVDEMDETIFNASLGQAMEQVNYHGKTIGEYIVASSTWQDCWLVR